MAANRTSWSELRDRRMAEPGAAEEYDATRLNKQVVYELLRRAGLDLVEELPLIPPQPVAEVAAPAPAK